MSDTSENNTEAKAPAQARSWRKLVRAAWALLAIAIVVVVGRKLTAPAEVRVVHPQRGALVAEAFGTGTLEAKVVVALSAKITGKVVEVLVDQGDTVTNGQVVARLEATDYENSVRVADAQVKQAQAELVKARLDWEHGRSVPSQAISQMQLDAYEAAYRVAEATVHSAEASLGFAKARLADTVIYSPVTGRVLVRNLEVGDTVVPGTPIFSIADTQQPLWIAAMVDERVAGGLRVDQSARITFRAYPGQSFPGRLARLAQEADRVTEEREADVTADKLPPDWFVGAKADVYIETAWKADALQIPRSAIVRRGEQAGVFVVSGGHARWRPVELGLTGRDSVELAGGVAADDWVIANPFAGKKPIADVQRVAPEQP